MGYSSWYTCLISDKKKHLVANSSHVIIVWDSNRIYIYIYNIYTVYTKYSYIEIVIDASRVSSWCKQVSTSLRTVHTLTLICGIGSCYELSIKKRIFNTGSWSLKYWILSQLSIMNDIMNYVCHESIYLYSTSTWRKWHIDTYYQTGCPTW